MRITTLSVFAGATMALATPALATGGFGCTAEDANLTFNADAAMSRGMGGMIINLTASVAIGMEGIPADFRSLTLDDALTHSWVDGDELKLQFYAERQAEPFASLDLTVETKIVEEGAYRGTYALAVFAEPPESDPDRDMWLAEGVVTCFVE
jgi:hypothetical protein